MSALRERKIEAVSKLYRERGMTPIEAHWTAKRDVDLLLPDRTVEEAIELLSTQKERRARQAKS